MSLLNGLSQPPINLLPKDGVAEYYGPILPIEKADIYFDSLLRNIEWQRDKVVLFGKTIETQRKVAWYGDQHYDYTYSNTTKQARPWALELQQLKRIVEHQSGESFNSCLLNLYHDGSESVSWHSDGEKELKKFGAIASLSLGAERKFSFKHKKPKSLFL